MCKEDIRLARAAASGATFAKTAPVAAVQLLPANPLRYALAAGVGVLSPLTLNVSCLIAARVGDQYVPLIGLSADQPTGYVNVTTHGNLIFEQIWFVPAGSDPPTNLYGGESTFVQDLESI